MKRARLRLVRLQFAKGVLLNDSDRLRWIIHLAPLFRVEYHRYTMRQKSYKRQKLS